MNHDEQKKIPDLSVVVLCYRAEKEVYDFVLNVKKEFLEGGVKDYELVLVGNYQAGVVDLTPGIVRDISLSDERVKFVAKVKKGMMGWDMKSGLEKAQGRYVAVIDGDGQMPIKDLLRVFQEIKKRKVDFVKTYRIKRGDGLWRKTLSFFYNLVFAMFFPGLKARDVNSKPKIMTREFYEKLDLLSDDWFIDAEIMISVRRFKASVYELPTEFRGLSGKRKSFVRLSAIFEFVKNFLVYRFWEFFK